LEVTLEGDEVVRIVRYDKTNERQKHEEQLAWYEKAHGEAKERN
jgi:hypothetical protein